ncbi:hypothetical protein C7S14_8090 [Burkholderia cepacia]|nr:hypothetical protein C7S14_8090 [Burkholderia cepacia]
MNTAHPLAIGDPRMPAARAAAQAGQVKSADRIWQGLRRYCAFSHPMIRDARRISTS